MTVAALLASFVATVAFAPAAIEKTETSKLIRDDAFYSDLHQKPQEVKQEPALRIVAIVTAAELRAAAAEVPLAKTDFFIPEKESAVESALATRFFNRPEEQRYAGITNADWRAKWQLFSASLVAKAKREGFDSESLDACLRALNQGRNEQTMLIPYPGPPSDTPGAELTAAEKEAGASYQAALKDREKHPEKWYDDSFAIVPVAAYLGRHAKGTCWIIVCKWEQISEGEALPLGHIRVWAIDTKSRSVVGYATCD